MDTSSGYDTVLYREPVGVFAGIVPFNFPGMVPMGWMAPLCIATGNTLIIKASPVTPMTALRCAELWQEAGLPDGVLNVLTCANKEAEMLLTHPDVTGISFVGSTTVGKHIYATAAANGKRVQVPDRGQEPRHRPARRGGRAGRHGHHQLELRLCRYAMYGASRAVRRECRGR